VKTRFTDFGVNNATVQGKITRVGGLSFLRMAPFLLFSTPKIDPIGREMFNGT
jgi:hypothetical protein